MTTHYQQAKKEDVQDLEQFLAGANVSTQGVRSRYEFYLLARDESGKMVAAIGLEPMKNVGLLRSFVFNPSFPYEKIPILLQQILIVAQKHELHGVYLATDKEHSLPLFEALGFKRVDPTVLPAVFYHSEHGKQLLSVDNCHFLYRSL
jgi:N-acetylglutamate synthase-like GNAT family acetyltransferase